MQRSYLGMLNENIMKVLKTVLIRVDFKLTAQ